MLTLYRLRLPIAPASLNSIYRQEIRHASLTRAIDKGVRRGNHAADRHVGRSNSFEPRATTNPRAKNAFGRPETPARDGDRRSSPRDSFGSRTGERSRESRPGGHEGRTSSGHRHAQSSEYGGSNRGTSSPGLHKPMRARQERRAAARAMDDHDSEGSQYTRTSYSRPERHENGPPSYDSRKASSSGDSRDSENHRPTKSGYNRNEDNGRQWRRSGETERPVTIRKDVFPATDGPRPARPQYGAHESDTSPRSRNSRYDDRGEMRGGSRSDDSSRPPREPRSFEPKYDTNRDRGKPVDSRNSGLPDHERSRVDNLARQDRAKDRETQRRREDAAGDWRADIPKHMKNKFSTYAPESIPYTSAASEFLYGTFATKAAIQADRRVFHKLYVSRGVTGVRGPEDASVQKLALASGIKVQEVAGPQWEQMLDKMVRGAPHNGYVLEAGPLPRLPVVSLGEIDESGTIVVESGPQGEEEKENTKAFGKEDTEFGTAVAWDKQASKFPLFLFLDRILDPGNLGAILRSAYFFGVAGVVVVSHGSAPFSPVTIKTSAGAAEFIPIFEVKNDVEFMKASKRAGWKFLAAVASNPFDDRTSLELERQTTSALQQGPVVLMLGNEGEGLRPRLQSQADGLIMVAGSLGVSRLKIVDSLNVSVAAALLTQQLLVASRANEETQFSSSVVDAKDSNAVF